MHRQLACTVAEPHREVSAASLVGLEGAALLLQPTSEFARVHSCTLHNTFVAHQAAVAEGLTHWDEHTFEVLNETLTYDGDRIAELAVAEPRE